MFLAKRISKSSVLPSRSSKGAAGYDLSSSEHTVVPAKGQALVSTGIAVSIPSGCYGRIAPRSGLAVKCGIDVGAGVIDEDYRGELKVLLFNFSTEDHTVAVGDRIAQIILENIATPELHEVSDLGSTERGGAGFGSTGVGVGSTGVGLKSAWNGLKSTWYGSKAAGDEPVKDDPVKNGLEPTGVGSIHGASRESKEFLEALATLGPLGGPA